MFVFVGGGRWLVDQGLANDAEHQIGNFSPISCWVAALWRRLTNFVLVSSANYYVQICN